MSGSVTAAQRDVFLEAYRNTFSAENHGKELKMLYLHFAERFVVDADVLRGIVQEDLLQNPKFYAKLRSALAAERLVDLPPEKPTKEVGRKQSAKRGECPACGQRVEVAKGGIKSHLNNGVACSGRIGACQDCGEMHPVGASNGLIPEHYLPGAKKCCGSNKKPLKKDDPTGGANQCPVCGAKVKRMHNGTLKLHRAQGRVGSVRCPGSGLKVSPPRISGKRPDDRSDSRSIRTVTSGLGSLGKR